MEEEAIDWREYMGCIAWFNPADAYLEIVSHTKTVKASSNDGPMWTIVGEKGEMLRISCNMVNIAECPKQYVRILTPLLDK